MHYNFDTEDTQRAKAALILYAAYRSRKKSSALNGLETWERFTSYIRGACLKSTTTSEFVTNFCKMAKIGSIKPKYLSDSNGFTMMPDGTVVQSDNIKNYRCDFLEDDSLLSVFENDGIILTMLIRERIQREKMEGVEDEDED